VSLGEHRLGQVDPDDLRFARYSGSASPVPTPTSRTLSSSATESDKRFFAPGCRNSIEEQVVT